MLDKWKNYNYSYSHKRSGFFQMIHRKVYQPQLKALKKRSKRMSSQREMSGEACGGRHFEIRIR